eukprot:359309-Chlamydomonas_euryale.AAC.1
MVERTSVNFASVDLCMESGHSLLKAPPVPCKLQEEPLWKISMENQPRIKRHFQKAREAADVDSLHKVH